MPTNISEMNLEDMILAYLRDKQGYEVGTTNDYVKDYALDTERVKRFLLSTQNQITGAVLLITAKVNDRLFLRPITSSGGHFELFQSLKRFVV